MADQKFTSQDVSREAQRVRHVGGYYDKERRFPIADMLDAFAARLEADDRFDGLQQVDTRQSMNTVADYALIEQGRREVYDKIKALDLCAAVAEQEPGR